MNLELTFTLGPASAEEHVLQELARVAHRFRLNASHLGPEELSSWLARQVLLQPQDCKEGRQSRLADLAVAQGVVGDLQAVEPREVPALQRADPGEDVAPRGPQFLGT